MWMATFLSQDWMEIGLIKCRKFLCGTENVDKAGHTVASLTKLLIFAFHDQMLMQWMFSQINLSCNSSDQMMAETLSVLIFPGTCHAL